MTSKQLKSIRRRLGLTQRDLANWVAPNAKNQDRLIRRWEGGELEVPNYMSTLMLMFEDGGVPRHIKEMYENDPSF